MEINPHDLASDSRYRLLTGAVIPRPIALDSTVSEDGCLNVAPFSYFSIASHDPMALSICITGVKPDRSSKDTLMNIQATRQFIVSVATKRYAKAVVMTSSPLPRETSEFEYAELTPAPAHRVKVPRVVQSPICFECELMQVIPVGKASLVIGEVVHVLVEDGFLDDRFRMDFDRLGAIGRLAGTSYSRTLDRLDFKDEGFFPTQKGPIAND